MKKILDMLYEHQEKDYQLFIAKLSPTLPIEHFIGVRVPYIRKMVGMLSVIEKETFLNELPHQYHEENLLHGFIIQKMKDYEECIKRINEFIPYLDNWAVGDSMIPKMFSKHLDKLINEANRWIDSKYPYGIRFGIDIYMSFYLSEDTFLESYLYKISSIKSNEYYVNMMIAWYYATALALQYDSTVKLIESNILDKWIHNKSIQKAVESFRVSDEHKAYLKTLRR